MDYRVDILLFCWPDGGEWNGTLLDHFENWTFDGFRGALDHVDAWSTLARSGSIPWSNGATASDAVGLLTARPADHCEKFWPLIVYTPRVVHRDHFAGGSVRSRQDVEEALRVFEANPAGYRPVVDGLWTAFDDTVNHVCAHSGRHRPRSAEQALEVAALMKGV